MTGTFSFMRAPIENVLLRAHEVMPGIEKVLAVFYDERADSPRILLSHRQDEGSRTETIR
ncbi:MAG: hypothetical protein U5L09_05520 [Bacteroidales bacterium]|nr:hypothetical protein [Bacteroidales bacterium]